MARSSSRAGTRTASSRSSVETELTGITGLRLEVLPDSRLPNKGPGRATDGNFVLNELEVTAAPKADPKQAKPVKLEKALADFSQDGFPVANAIDGNANEAGNGWAVSPATGIVHWATFEAAQPVGGPGGTVLTIKLHHKYSDVWTLGRFRLSATRSAKPVGLSLPEDFRAILAVAPRCGPRPRRTTLLAYFRVMDAELKAKTDALAASRAPLPVDAKLQELRAQLEFAKKPVQPDPALLALRRDVEMSVEQAADPPAHRRPGHRLGADQQPGVPVQPLIGRLRSAVDRGDLSRMIGYRSFGSLRQSRFNPDRRPGRRRPRSAARRRDARRPRPPGSRRRSRPAGGPRTPCRATPPESTAIMASTSARRRPRSQALASRSASALGIGPSSPARRPSRLA